MKRIYIGLVALGFALSGHYADAQRRRTQGPTIDVPKVIEEAEALHRAYAFADALKQVDKAISTLSRQRKEIPSELSSLQGRISRAHRLVARTERLNLLSAERMPTSELSSYLQAQVPGLGESIRIELDVDGTIVSSDFVSPIGSSGLYAKPIEGRGYDLISAELIERDNQEDDVIEEPVGGNINTPEDENFPYLMPDGITLLFGRRSPHGLGEYDLYMSRYNWRRNAYLEPSMLGMPFNSPCNDYLLIYDDRQEICLLVSDRDCMKGQIAVFKIEGLPRPLVSQVENSAEVELSSEEALIYARLGQEPSAPSKSSDVVGSRLSSMKERNILHFGISEIHSSVGKEYAEKALRTYEELEFMRQRQHRMRQSYRQTPSSRAELSPQLNALEQEIARLHDRYKSEVRQVREAERP